MTNYEFYKEQLKEIKSESISGESCTTLCNFMQKHIHRGDCTVNDCSICKAFFSIWLLEEHEEPEIDWSKVKVDTPVLVWDCENDKPCKRHFAKYEDELIYTYCDGGTSWTESDTVSWKHGRLAKEATQ